MELIKGKVLTTGDLKTGEIQTKTPDLDSTPKTSPITAEESQDLNQKLQKFGFVRVDMDLPMGSLQ